MLGDLFEVMSGESLAWTKFITVPTNWKLDLSICHSFQMRVGGREWCQNLVTRKDDKNEQGQILPAMLGNGKTFMYTYQVRSSLEQVCIHSAVNKWVIFRRRSVFVAVSLNFWSHRNIITFSNPNWFEFCHKNIFVRYYSTSRKSHLVSII